MNFGMMWYDNDPKTGLSDKIKRAAEYYRQKYGKSPNLCLVNPKSLTGEIEKSGDISVRSQKIVLPGHLWIGREDSEG